MTTSAVTAAANVNAVLAGNEARDRINTPEMDGVLNKNLLLAPNIQPEIKSEPPEDIDDTLGYGAQDERLESNSNHSNEDVPLIPLGIKCEANSNSSGTGGCESPKIRLTPTIKLMATPNPTDPKRKFVCPYESCTKSYGKSSHLRSHLTWHTGIKPFVCQEPNCGKGFTRSDELNRHIRTHTGEKPFECVQCTKKFSRSDHLTKHLATHAKQMQMNATKRYNSGYMYSEEPDVKRMLTDMQNDADPLNPNDGMHFMAALLDSNRMVDGTGLNAGVAPAADKTENLTDEPVFRHVPIKIKLERPEHSNEYHVVQPPHLQPPPPLTPKPQLLQQRELHSSPIALSSSYPHTPTTLNVNIHPEPHDDIIMPEANALPPQTLPCNATTSCGLPIPLHIQDYPKQSSDTIPPERPFVCNKCPKNFKRLDDLNRHLRTHSGEKPFVCNECDRRFLRKDHLNKHMKTHTRVQLPLSTTVVS